MTSAIILYLVLAPAGLASLDSVQVFLMKILPMDAGCAENP
jgi:hypothetical protein